jgi:hypothetical protein
MAKRFDLRRITSPIAPPSAVKHSFYREAVATAWMISAKPEASRPALTP